MPEDIFSSGFEGGGFSDWSTMGTTPPMDFSVSSMIPPEVPDVDFGQSFVPDGLMSKLMGLEMPAMDDRGYFGINEIQKKDAQFRALGEALSAAGNGFLTGNMRNFQDMGQVYNRREESLLDKYSQANVKNILGQMEFGQKKLSAAKGISELQQAEINRQKAEIEFKQKQAQHNGMVKMAQEYAPIIEYAAKESNDVNPGSGAAIKSLGAAALKALEAGQYDVAMQTMASITEITPEYVDKKLSSFVDAQTASTANKMNMNLKELESVVEHIRAGGGEATIELRNGKYTVITPRDRELEELNRKKLNADITQSNRMGEAALINANANMTQALGGPKLSEGQMNAITAVESAAAMFTVPSAREEAKERLAGMQLPVTPEGLAIWMNTHNDKGAFDNAPFVKKGANGLPVYDINAFYQWFSTPNPQLNGRTPAMAWGIDYATRIGQARQDLRLQLAGKK